MSNLTNNRLNVTMTAAQVTAVKTALQTIATNMPFLVGLTVEERVALPKINVSNKAFTEDAINAVANNAGILPAYINATTMQNDYQLFIQLDELLGLMRQLVEKAEDTQMLAGSEAFVAALSSYKLFGAAADAGLVGADAIVDSLRQRFIAPGTPETPAAP
ncbi:hypothetical protein [Flavobacterium sp. TBRC 19031]|uniref:hypothetical protein n=1 Tax=Flavobacterium mekongense TaxID=3379707 RepID=UPI00399A2D5C